MAFSWNSEGRCSLAPVIVIAGFHIEYRTHSIIAMQVAAGLSLNMI